MIEYQCIIINQPNNRHDPLPINGLDSSRGKSWEGPGFGGITKKIIKS